MRLLCHSALRLALLAPALAACAEGGGAPAVDATADASAVDVGGTLVIATPADPGILLPPFVVNVQGKQVVDLVYERLADIGPALGTVGDAGFAPRLADTWSWSADSLAITFRLDRDARWHDGTPVRSDDVRFTFELNRDPAVGSADISYLAAIDSVTTPDSLTATFWFGRRYPEQFFDATYHTLILPEHLLGDVDAAALRTSPFAREPVGSGPFRYRRRAPNALVELVADTGYHRGRPYLDRVIFAVSSSPVAASTQLLVGEADLYEALMPHHMAEVAKTEHVAARIFGGAAYNFLQFNLRDPSDPARAHPLFADRDMRRALTMLVDRATITRAVWDSLAAPGVGPFTRFQSTADTTLRQIAYDPAVGAQLLDSLGWRDTDGDGVRDRDGSPLAFTALVPSSSAPRLRAIVLMQEQFAAAGVRVTVEQMEFNTFIERETAGTFDAVMGAWVTDPSASGARTTWATRGDDRGDKNYGSYASALFDAQIDSGLAAWDPTAQRAHFRIAYQTIVDDAPAVWLYEAKSVIGIDRRLRTPPLRASAWWMDIPSWYIPAGERIERDNAGIPAVAP